MNKPSTKDIKKIATVIRNLFKKYHSPDFKYNVVCDGTEAKKHTVDSWDNSVYASFDGIASRTSHGEIIKAVRKVFPNASYHPTSHYQINIFVEGLN
jgi:hypothetical protein